MKVQSWGIWHILGWNSGGAWALPSWGMRWGGRWKVGPRLRLVLGPGVRRRHVQMGPWLCSQGLDAGGGGIAMDSAPSSWNQTVETPVQDRSSLASAAKALRAQVTAAYPPDKLSSFLFVTLLCPKHWVTCVLLGLGGAWFLHKQRQ